MRVNVTPPGKRCGFCKRYKPVSEFARLDPLTDDERAAIDDGRQALDALLARLSDIPTPSGPTPRQIGLPPTATRLPIVNVTQGTPQLTS
jgi:hypothetical protein